MAKMFSILIDPSSTSPTRLAFTAKAMTSLPATTPRSATSSPRPTSSRTSRKRGRRTSEDEWGKSANASRCRLTQRICLFAPPTIGSNPASDPGSADWSGFRCWWDCSTSSSAPWTSCQPRSGWSPEKLPVSSFFIELFFGFHVIID